MDFIYKQREKERNYEEWRDAERVEDREKGIYIDRKRGKPIQQPVCSQWQNGGESRLIQYKTTVKTLY